MKRTCTYCQKSYDDGLKEPYNPEGVQLKGVCRDCQPKADKDIAAKILRGDIWKK
jgi:hypothetical protein